MRRSFGKEGVDCTAIYERAYAAVKKAGLEEHFMGFGPEPGILHRPRARP